MLPPGANWRRKFPWFCAPMSFCIWPAESLAGINLAVETAEIAFEEGEKDSSSKDQPSLSSTGAYLADIHLPHAVLLSADLEGAFLQSANFENAILANANLKGTVLLLANLEGAFLLSASFEGAALQSTNLEGAFLQSANLKNAFLDRASLKDAFLEKANFEDASLVDVDLREARGLSTVQITQAKLCRTMLPPGIVLSPNRDCVEIGVDPKTGLSLDKPEEE